jgi:hypothetical protein
MTTYRIHLGLLGAFLTIEVRHDDKSTHTIEDIGYALAGKLGAVFHYAQVA